MDPEKRAKIAQMGGRAAHKAGTAHEFTSEEAKIAGARGGQRVSSDRSHMAAIGAKGGFAKAGNKQAIAKLEEGSDE
jgi:general stress protein YciG